MQDEDISEEYNLRARKSSSSSRIIMLTSEVNDNMANAIVAELLKLEAENPNKPIEMYINSPGGSVSAGLMIYDAMMYIKPPVHTIGMGMCASMASFLLSAGNPGNRYILPNTRDMAHQPSGGARGKESDIKVSAQEIKNIRRRMEMLYAHFLKVPYDDEFKELINDVMENDSYFNATMALKLGLVDKVLAPRDEKARDSDFKVVMEINQMEYDEIGKDSPKNLRAAKRLIEAREAYLATQTQKTVSLRLVANQP